MNIPPTAKTPRNTVYNYILYTVKLDQYIAAAQEVTYIILDHLFLSDKSFKVGLIIALYCFISRR